MIRWLTRCESTQDALNAEPPTTSAVATLEQTQGRGRRGRRWVSPAQTSLALSWRAPIDRLCAEELPLISLAAGVGLYRWIEGLERPSDSPLHPRLCLKWPNDLLFEGRKLAGILCEGRVRGDHQEVIVGLGVNLSLHQQLPPGCAALDELISPESRSALPLREVSVPALVVELDDAVERLAENRATLLAEWSARGLPLGTSLRAGGRVGVYQGVDERGALRLNHGEEQTTVESGEVELLGSLAPPDYSS